MNAIEKTAIIGLGARTGESLVRFFELNTNSLVLVDDKPQEKFLHLLANTQAVFEHSSQLSKAFECATWLVSPGVPLDKPYFDKARSKGIRLLSEIDFAAARVNAPIFAVTGSNGKSTTVSLLGHILCQLKSNVFVGGNLGTPFVEAIGKSWDAIVLELSSFQLELSESVSPNYALISNLSPNHLDRHGDMNHYFLAKKRIFQNMQKGTAFINLDEMFCDELMNDLPCSKITFSTNASKRPDCFLDEKNNSLLILGENVSLDQFQLIGRHNRINALMAASMAYMYGVSKTDIETGLSSFKSLEHRLESLGMVHGLTFINDSKSTSPHATLQALSALHSPLILLMGGRAKTDDFSSLEKSILSKVKKTILYGESALLMKKSLTNCDCIVVENLKDAFDEALRFSTKHDTILLSPANTSWDQFKDFEERGQCFKSLVQGFERRAS